MKLGSSLTEGPITKKYIAFIIPILLSGIMQQLYNTADILVVGKFVGDTALAAVGSTSSITHLILNIFIGLSVGANVVCAHLYGANDKEALSRALHTSILLALLSGVFLAIVGFVFSRTFLTLMGNPSNVIDDATLYMQIFFLGSPASMIYNFGSAVLRAAGDTKRPFYIMLLSGIVNVILNLFCVLVLKIGVAGVAIGTVASQIVSAVMVLYFLMKSTDCFKLRLSKLRLFKRELMQIIAIGVPSGLNGIMFSASNVIIQSTINSFGKIAIAGASATTNIENYGFILFSSVEQGAITFVGQNMGAKKIDRVKSVAKIALFSAFVCAAAYTAVTIIWGKSILGLFTDDVSREAVVAMGMVKMTITSFSYIIFAPAQAFSGVLKGMGKSVVVTVANAICTCVVRILWVIFIFPLNPILEMVYLAYPISWGLSSIATTILYFAVRNKVFNKELSTPK